ncbi:MAG: 50S ribosomal protein L13 [Defluviitaleaceae bacterium]|nr:50S ribosomal protein L13 [Defluviitaleaceae bacterium]
MRTTYILKAGDINRKWFVVDAEGLTLGRLSTEVAHILRGKHKPTFTPNMDNGDFVIIVNAEKIHVTGKKMDDKIYKRHSGHPGGLKETTLKTMLARKPADVLKLAVRGMLPKNNLGREMFKKLKVYAGPTHNHDAQKPEVLVINNELKHNRK